MPGVLHPGPCQLWITFPAVTSSQVPSREEGDMFIAIASSSPTSPSRAARHHPPPRPFLYGAGICAWMNISPGSLGAVTQRMGGGYLNCHRGSTVWSQPCQHHGCKVKPPIFPSPCLEDSSPSTRCPLFPHHHTLEKLFRPNPEPGEALQPNLWTSPCFPRQLPSTTLPANSSHAGRSRLLPPTAPGRG